MFRTLGILEEMDPPEDELITIWSDRPPQMRMVGAREVLINAVRRWGTDRIGRRMATESEGTDG
jgi:hypothetical protein